MSLEKGQCPSPAILVEPSTVSPSSPATIPAETQDGGLRAWTCVAGAFLCQFCSFGFINAYAMLIVYHLPKY
jgi:hypothetical protein